MVIRARAGLVRARTSLINTAPAPYECRESTPVEPGTASGTAGEGIDNQGIVFRLTPQNSGKWSETVLFKFNGKDEAHPSAGLILDAAGNLFGTTVNGGASGDGSVFEFIP